MITMERIYIIPLRKQVIKAPEYRRAKKAVNTLREFLLKHMKVDDNHLRIDNSINKFLWSKGIKNPPMKVKVKVTKDDKGIATAVLFGAEEESKIIEQKEKKKESKGLEKLADKLEEAREAKKETKKEVPKEVIKAEKAEKPKAEKKE